MPKYNKIYEGRLPSSIRKDAIEVKNVKPSFNLKSFLSHLVVGFQDTVLSLFKK